MNVTNNDYYDFTGYADFYNKVKNTNSILLFSDSSVSLENNLPIIDEYVTYFKNNKDVGILGISGNSRNYQSLINNNFSPHVQSMFFMSSVEVLKNVILANGNIFPGLNAKKENKYSIIRNGEILLSKIILSLGYSIAIIKSDGHVFKYSENDKIKKPYLWKNYYLGDARLESNYPSQAVRILYH